MSALKIQVKPKTSVQKGDIIVLRVHGWCGPVEQGVHLIFNMVQYTSNIIMRKSYGIILINQFGTKVLLKRQRHNFGGVLWTFPKGHQEDKETPRQTALRELWEETHMVPLSMIRLSGKYYGTTTVSRYFIGVSTESATPNTSLWKVPVLGSLLNFETLSLRWASWDEAKYLISLSPNQISRDRDLQVLNRAKKNIVNALNSLY